MPLARYFLYVGGVLLALLFALDAFLPELPVAASVDTSVDKPIIRIHSDRKWPDRVVFDTSQPTLGPAQTANSASSLPAAATVTDSSGAARARDSYAQLQSADQSHAQVHDPKKLEKKAVQKRRIAKRRTAPPVMLVAQQPQFGFFGSNTW
jgi:hypothetical protein